MTINAIVFDMDDTLYEEKDYVRSGFKAIDSLLIDELHITGFYETAMELFQEGETKLIFNKTLEKLNVEFDDKLIARLVDAYRSHKPDIQLLEDSTWVFKHLNRSCKIGLISDGYLIAQERKVRALQLEEKCHSVILTDRWGREHWKPSPLPYEQACVELKLPHNQCVYVGDNVSKDFITAKKLGWTTVHIHRKDGIYSNMTVQEAYRAHYTINDLKSLSELPVSRHMFS